MNEYIELINAAKENFKYHSYAIIYLIADWNEIFWSTWLTWNDVDFNDKIIDVNKTYNYKYYIWFCAHKNASSVGRFPVDDQTLSFTKEYKEEYWRERAKQNLASVSVQ